MELYGYSASSYTFCSRVRVKGLLGHWESLLYTLLYSFIILAYIGKIYTYFMIDCLSKAGYVVLNRVTNYHLWNLSSITWLIQPKVWYTHAKLFLILRSRLLNKGWTSEITTTLSWQRHLEVFWNFLVPHFQTVYTYLVSSPPYFRYKQQKPRNKRKFTLYFII